MPEETPQDLTPAPGTRPDPRGGSGPTPLHPEPGTVDWKAVAQMPEFQALVRAKFRFIVPATLFFILYYFALPVLVGYFPELMSRPVLGPVNGAYLFALSQFFMAWILAALYVKVSGKFDRQAREIRQKVLGAKGEHR
ncbi:MAG: DUF485 domain-containing protein [Verrucomicrobiae bacterium]|nr:DUF485 domain-containing protein [Verrucomicrobiae bacterium]